MANCINEDDISFGGPYDPEIDQQLFKRDKSPVRHYNSDERWDTRPERDELEHSGDKE